MKEPTELLPSAKLRLARAYMAEHGFSPYTFDDEKRCFIGALGAVGFRIFECDSLKELLRPHLTSQLPLQRRLFSFDGLAPTFSERFLIDGKFDTKKALAVFDAAIAEAERAEAAL